jgi:hypothetical protein
MGRRDAIPLHRTRHAEFVDAADNHPDPDEQVASLLHIGSGGRGDTICHVHADWFRYKRPTTIDHSKFTEDYPPLYLKIPSQETCRKYGTDEPCGDCNRTGHVDEKDGKKIGRYEPKTPAGEGREILISDEWYNPVTGEQEYYPLRDVVESYFSLSGTHAPDGVEYGNDMIDGDGISLGTLNEWERKVGAEAKISRQEREDWLRKHIGIENPEDDENDRKTEQIVDFGTDRDGNEIPDIISHDMRASFITQLMRPVTRCTRQDAIPITGHAVAESMDTYLAFANDEVGSKDEVHYH